MDDREKNSTGSQCSSASRAENPGNLIRFGLGSFIIFASSGTEFSGGGSGTLNIISNVEKSG